MSRTRQSRVAAAAASMAIVGGVFSLLIWGKLRLVGPVPRSAYAEPAPEATTPTSPAEAASGLPVTNDAKDGTPNGEPSAAPATSAAAGPRP
ncbi:MAG: hypothetical protein IT439_02285 [Phycisphaerales bacterium]|nr:hypothetical protein [Phycisphaerales bacterium]